MPYTQSRWVYPIAARSLSFAICLGLCTQFFVYAQSADEAALRALAENFFAAYEKKDVKGLASLWNTNSPDLAANKQTIQQNFVAVGRIELKSFSIHKTTVSDGKATVRVVIEMSALDTKTGKPAEGFGRLDRTLHCVKEGVDWKVWRYTSSEEDLAAALVSAKTEEERRALLVAEKELVTIELENALTSHGKRLFNQGRYREALTIYHLAGDIAEQLADKIGIVATLRSIGNVLFSQGKYPSALECYQKSLKLAEEIGSTKEIVSTLNDIGEIHAFQGEHTRALEDYGKSLQLAEELGDRVGIADSLNGMGNVHYFQGSYTAALEDYQRSLKLAEELGDKARTARTLGNIGNIRCLEGDYAEGLKYLQNSVKLLHELGKKDWIANSLNSMGVIYRLQGNYAKALEYYQNSLKLAEELGDRGMIADLLNNIGVVHQSQGNYTQALEYHQNSLKLKEELGYKTGIVTSLNNIGDIYAFRGSYTQAMKYYEDGLKLGEEIGNKAFIAYAVNGIGSVHFLEGNYAKALEYQQKSLKLAEELGNKAWVAAALRSIGNIHLLQTNYAKAVELANSAAALARQVNSPESFWRARALAGKAYRNLNQPDQARQAFDDAITTIENLRSQVAGGEQEWQHFFENKVSPYYAMVDLLIDQNSAAEALAYAERAKGRVLLDVVQNGRVNITKAMTNEEQEQERKLNGELVSLNSQIFREKLQQQPDQPRVADLNARLQKARLKYESFQTSLYAAHPELKMHRGQMQPLTPDEAIKLIPDAGTALLEFAVTEDKSFLFVLTKNKQGPGTTGRESRKTTDAGIGEQTPRPVTAPQTRYPAVALKVYTLNIKQKVLADISRRFSQRLADRRPGFQEPASQLYDLLLKPARAQLQDISTLVIVPDDVLWELPFQALQPSPDRYLIEDYAISYTPSLTVLREMMKQRLKQSNATTAVQTLVAFGNPAIGNEMAERVKTVFMDEKLAPLPEAERLVKSLGQLYGSGRSNIYIGADAQEERLKAEAGHYRILHLATHAILNDASPMYSQVVLAQPQGNGIDDGLLEAWEIMKLDLKAELVVLSACDTARGRVGAGEGVIGLSWALFVAGCPTAVVSQWKVESASTTNLMVAFHRNLKSTYDNRNPNGSKAKALRRAALELLRSKQYNHPFYWAAFVVVGDGTSP